VQVNIGMGLTAFLRLRFDVGKKQGQTELSGVGNCRRVNSYVLSLMI
jgi:hypothetical protein